MNTISSRTPEGKPNRCPICNAEFRIEPSSLFGDAPCPSCGHLIWFLNLRTATLVYEHEAGLLMREHVIEFIAAKLGVEKDKVPTDGTFSSFLGLDSLEVLELAMDLEDKFGE